MFKLKVSPQQSFYQVKFSIYFFILRQFQANSKKFKGTGDNLVLF